MIIGKGDIAGSLTEAGIDREDITFFASGVSDSKNSTVRCHEREINLIRSQSKKNHFVYFSSLSIYYSESTYALNKLLKETIVKSEFPHYTIVRLGNITWGQNPNTIINYFKLCYKKGIQPELQDTHRYLISKEDFIHWLKLIRVGINDIMNLPGETVHVKEIWRRVQNGYY